MRLHRMAFALMAGFATLFAPTAARAYVLDWGDFINIDWDEITNPADEIQSFVDVNNSDVDIRITLTRGSGTAETEYNAHPNEQTSGGVSYLLLDMNWTDETDANEYLDVKLEFFETGTSEGTKAAVYGVSFYVLDIDKKSSGSEDFEDDVRNFSANNDGATAFGPTLTEASPNTYNTGGSGTTQTVIGDSTNSQIQAAKGRVDVDFGNGNLLTEFSFRYKPGPNSSGNDDPDHQQIGFGDITFTPVPEAGTTSANSERVRL